MKSTIFSILASAAMLAGVTSCDSYEPEIASSKEGKLNTSSIAVEVSNAEKIINEGSAAHKGLKSRSTVDLTNYQVTVVDANGMPVEKWSYSQMPELPTFAEGTYTVKVESGEEPIAASWESPYFRGEQTFTIKAEEITEVDVVKCTLANIRVSVRFTDELLNAAGSDLKVVVRSEGAQSLTWTADETRSGYFAAVDGLETLSVAFSGTVSGTQEKFTKAMVDVAAGQHRIITFGLKTNPNTPPVPSGQIDSEGINVSTEVIEEDLTADIPYEEEVLDPSDRPGQEGEDPNGGGGDEPTPPTPPAENDAIKFTSYLDGVKGMDYEYDLDEFVANGYKADLTVDAPAGIAKMIVKIESDVLTPDALTNDLNLSDQFDLVNPGNIAEGIQILGFPVGDDVKNKTILPFDITGFMVPLKALGQGRSHFIITVTDNDGNVSSTAFKFNKK